MHPSKRVGPCPSCKSPSIPGLYIAGQHCTSLVSSFAATETGFDRFHLLSETMTTETWHSLVTSSKKGRAFSCDVICKRRRSNDSRKIAHLRRRRTDQG
ncbi:hypothetical protein BO82DRAFT_142617 [Aspergillus uvarum CBS 121591]|uniref:Uncharacterized protein n=1 Tax=Aspergillus uvarum CBS 121591 TaxID=1448315 RepID=A0A319DCU8_9EURO|nr:hypothetical protein BO82DRAFT_142617 [Aspergillus uvarum CBS 121591]PYH85938.1 hypothetical protein BO82DRAFT_142617 [Aspergillus uvarum CBS 121591]